MKIKWYTQLDSTQSLLKQTYAPHTILATLHQKKGKGRSTTNWYHQPKSLAFSFISKKNYIHILSAIKETLIFFNLNVYMKWPNDILVNGKKVCGVVLDTNKNMNCVGVGVNLGYLCGCYGGCVECNGMPGDFEMEFEEYLKLNGEMKKNDENLNSPTENNYRKWLMKNKHALSPPHTQFHSIYSLTEMCINVSQFLNLFFYFLEKDENTFEYDLKEFVRFEGESVRVEGKGVVILKGRRVDEGVWGYDIERNEIVKKKRK